MKGKQLIIIIILLIPIYMINCGSVEQYNDKKIDDIFYSQQKLITELSILVKNLNGNNKLSGISRNGLVSLRESNSYTSHSLKSIKKKTNLNQFFISKTIDSLIIVTTELAVDSKFVNRIQVTRDNIIVLHLNSGCQGFINLGNNDVDSSYMVNSGFIFNYKSLKEAYDKNKAVGARKMNNNWYYFRAPISL